MYTDIHTYMYDRWNHSDISKQFDIANNMNRYIYFKSPEIKFFEDWKKRIQWTYKIATLILSSIKLQIC